MSASPFAMTCTCSECPWLRSSAPAKFTPECYLQLAETCKPGGLREIFTCHMTPDGSERACAGMLLVCGLDNNVVRLAIIQKRVDIHKVRAIGELYRSCREMAVANGCESDSLEFRGLPE
jgi:hypothetical protein